MDSAHKVVLDHALGARTGGDVTRVIQKLFDRHADLFPVRPRGGVTEDAAGAFYGAAILTIAALIIAAMLRTVPDPVPAAADTL